MRVNPTKDLMDKVYYGADIYTHSMRPVAGEEKRQLENRMKWVLTGGEEFGKDSKTIGREAGVIKQDEAAEKRMQGMKTAKRLNKRSLFDSRKKKTVTDTKIDLDHILFGASNNLEEEAEDSEMEVRMLNVRKITIMINSYRKLPQVRKQELEDHGAEMPLSLTLMAHL